MNMGKKRQGQINNPPSASNGYSQQQQLVIPGWSTSNVGLNMGQGQGQGQSQQEIQNGLIRDWNWRPELAYASSSSLLEGLTEFGIAQQRLIPATRPADPTPHPHPHSSTSNSNLTGPETGSGSGSGKAKSRRKKNATRTTDKRELSRWSKGSEDVVEKFIWGGKWECEKLVSNEFICCACGALKQNRPNLITHLTYHRLLESKRWACKSCGKCFSRQREVERHERTHLTKTKSQDGH